MYNNGKWEKPKVVMYCQIGGAIDMAEFSINGEFGALKNTGLSDEDFDIVFICWKTPAHTYDWLKKNNFKHVEMEYDEGKGFLWNLYKGWNIGYTIGFEKGAEYICPIATDHAFHKDWLLNLLKNGKANRIVNCKLIEPGTLPTLHTAINFGLTTEKEFNASRFVEVCKIIADAYAGQLVFDDCIPNSTGGAYGHRLDAMPFLCHKDVWDRFGPMKQVLTSDGTTGDTDFFNRCKAGGVEITKALDAISYHCGGVETKINQAKGVYT